MQNAGPARELACGDVRKEILCQVTPAGRGAAARLFTELMGLVALSRWRVGNYAGGRPLRANRASVAAGLFGYVSATAW